MRELVILPELQNLLPSLSPDEYAGLEADILKHGCRDAIVVWKEIIIDGFSRYDICRKHGLTYNVISMDFDSLDEAKLWMWKNQQNRRNLTPYARAELALRFKGMIETDAKEHQRNGIRSDEKPLKTRDVLGEKAGVSGKNIDKVEYISRYADEETKQKLRRGTKGISINKVFTELRQRLNEQEGNTFLKNGEISTMGENPVHSQSTSDGRCQTIMKLLEQMYAEEGQETMDAFLLEAIRKFRPFIIPQ